MKADMTIVFPERTLNSFATSVSARKLKKGTTYFEVVFRDEEMMVPEMHAVVYAGRHTTRGFTLYLFQDALSFFGKSKREMIEYDRISLRGLYSFQDAVDLILRCSIRRTKDGFD
jgi:hypothetical protein